MAIFAVQSTSPFYFPSLAPLLCGLCLQNVEGIYLILSFDLVVDPCLVGINSTGPS